MPNDPGEDEISFETKCDILERELKITLEDLEKLRKAEKSEAKYHCWMLKAALSNARHYLLEIEDSLKE